MRNNLKINPTTGLQILDRDKPYLLLTIISHYDLTPKEKLALFFFIIYPNSFEKKELILAYIGNRVTWWRCLNQLEKKGYLIKSAQNE